jgi:hypothetical protein
MKEFVEIANRLKFVPARFPKIEAYMDKLGKYPPAPIENWSSRGRSRRSATPTRWPAPRPARKLLAKVKKLSPPPAKKQFAGLYGNDATRMDKARTDFQKTIDDLTTTSRRSSPG